MPLHDVKCKECGHVQEIFFQPADEPKTIKCEKCKKYNNYKKSVLLGAPRIDMGGRLVERELEKDAADGIF